MAEELTGLPRQSLLLILLSMSSGRNDKNQLRTAITSVLDAAEQKYEIVEVHQPGALPRLAREAAKRVASEGGALIAAGGDGTISAVAAEALREDCGFGVIPQGTFNYFARAQGISEDATEATQALLGATFRPVQVGEMSGKIFLVNASLGLYPELLEQREAANQRFGRGRVVAFLAAVYTLFREHRQLAFSVEHDGVTDQRRARTLVVTNNRLQLEHVGLEGEDALTQGRLVAIALGKVGSWGLFTLLLRGTLRLLGKASNLNCFSFRRLEVRPGRRYGRRRLKVALDGEVSWQRSPLVFSVAERCLRLLVAPPVEVEDEE